MSHTSDTQPAFNQNRVNVHGQTGDFIEMSPVRPPPAKVQRLLNSDDVYNSDTDHSSRIREQLAACYVSLIRDAESPFFVELSTPTPGYSRTPTPKLT